LKVSFEMGEMWGRVYCKKTLCWLWHVINCNMGEVIVYVFGTRGCEVLQKFLTLFSFLNVEVEVVFSVDSFVYRDVIPVNVLFTGKCNTRRIECKYLSFCTRFKCLARRTICYSTSWDMHTITFGLLINVLEFGCKLF